MIVQLLYLEKIELSIPVYKLPRERGATVGKRGGEAGE